MNKSKDKRRRKNNAKLFARHDREAAKRERIIERNRVLFFGPRQVVDLVGGRS